MLKSRTQIRGRRDDGGNTMIIAMAVLMVMGILAATVWQTTLSGMNYAARDKRHTDTLSVSNAGLDEAVYRIEQFSPSQFDSGEVVDGIGSINGYQYRYRMTKGANPLSWTVVSTGAVGEITRSIAADINASGLYPYALYSGTSLTMNGNTGDDIYSYDSAVSLNAALETGRPGNASFGSSGSMDCQGNPGGATNHQYPPNGNSNCPNTIEETEPYDHDTPQVPTGTQACPGGGTITGAVAWNDLDPSTTYSCADLTIGTNASSAICTVPGVDQDHPVIIYVSGSLTFGDNVHVNVGDAANGGCNGPNEKPTAMPGGFRVLVTGTCDGDEIEIGSGSSNPLLAMVLDAPECDLVYDGGPHVFFFGAMTVNSYRSNGNIGTIAYDDNLSRLAKAGYKSENWREVPPVSI